MICVASVREQAAQVETGPRGHRADHLDGTRGQRIDAATMKADVHLDQHVHTPPRAHHRIRPLSRHGRVIDDERQARAIEQGDHAVRVRGIQGIRQPDVGDTALGEYFGLAEFRAADADGAAGDLPAGDDRALVRLGVRTQPHAARIGRRLHAVDVAQRACAIDENGRSGEPVDSHYCDFFLAASRSCARAPLITPSRP